MAFLAIAPTGTVLPFAGTSAPDGWLLCDGSEKSRTTYSKLFAVISTTYGVGDNSTTFNIPDMRGVFPRGQGTNGTSNYGGVTGHTPAGGALAAKGGQKTAKNGLTNANSAVSSLSLSGITAGHTHTDAGHAHNLSVPDQGASVSFGSNYVVGGPVTRVTTVAGANLLAQSADHTHNLSSGTATAQTIAGDTETTPASLALNYIIKL